MSKLFYVVAGEMSGDILGAGLMKALRKHFPDCQFKGIGGPQMVEQGLEVFYPFERLSVMGVVPILKRFPELLGMRKRLAKTIVDERPDCFIGIDAPVFNTEIEYQLKRQGIKTVHYVSPSVWAWRENRIHKIVKSVDLMICLFPFELDIYNQHKLPAVCVGHPLADMIPLETDKNAARKDLGFNPEDKMLAVLPGSRGSETKFLLAPFLQSIDVLTKDISELKVVIPCANDNRRKQIEHYLSEHPVEFDCALVDGRSREVMQACDWILLASGTATLEAMLFKLPMVVCYKVSKFSYWIYAKFLKIKNFALPNLLAGEPIVKELMQEDCTVINIVSELRHLIKGAKPENLQATYHDLHKALRLGGSEKAATAIADMLRSANA